ERKPEETAADLSKIIYFYRKQLKVKHVLLVGYSFVADVVPATYQLLKPAENGDDVVDFVRKRQQRQLRQRRFFGWL
ncbi:AcvB/VirJ family lysyl-phosphatidylglycerol hydrolase, partial [Rhizobium ruizarguesonis]